MFISYLNTDIPRRINRAAAAIAFVALAGLAGCATQGKDAPRHMIAAANPHAARAGQEMLRAGGGAVDAVIAAQMVLTLVEPQSSGIGGGAFLMHYNAPQGSISAYDGRETAPKAATPGMFIKDKRKPAFLDAVVSGRSVGVPGVLRMLEMAHGKHGKLPWARLFQPAIKLAEEGFAVSARLHQAIKTARRLKDMPAARAYFFTPPGEAHPAGTILKNPALADTLRTIARNGADAFYTGAIARDIVETTRATANFPGLLTLGDLKEYRAKKRAALCGPYRQWQVCGMPPPTSGGVAVLQILGMIEKFDLVRLGAGSAAAIHTISEASRLAYADRAQYLADSDFVKVPVAGLLERSYLARRGRLIKGTQSMGKAPPGLPRLGNAALAPDRSLELPSTSHISVVDADGNAVSMTTSVENRFGSRLLVRGFILNNQLTDFSLIPFRGDGRPVANRIQPGKRPRSSMSPTIVVDGSGRLVMAVGSPGGSRIIGYVVKSLVGVLDWKLSMQAAIDLPNHVNRNGATDLEKGTVLESAAPGLRRLGHKVAIRRMVSGLHGVRVTSEGLQGGADKRREGVVLSD